jgi:predicted GTPase
LQQARFEVDKAQLEARHRLESVSFAFNMLVVGVTGSGKSSSLNTVLDHCACRVSGGQGQGTRGTEMQDGAIGNDQFVTLIDTQGL